MNITPNFTLEEMTKSETARQRGILNQPNYQEINNLTKLCKELLQPIRDAYGKPITITSGFRNEALNRAVGGSSTSMHRKGLAADFVASDGKNKVLWDVIMKLHNEGKLPFDQLIWEKGTKSAPAWIHIGLNENKMRNQILRYENNAYKPYKA